MLLKRHSSLNKFYHQQTARQISFIHISRRLLQHVSAIAYSHLQEALIYKKIWVVSIHTHIHKATVNGKMHCTHIITISKCGVDIVMKYLQCVLQLNTDKVKF